MKAKHTPGPWEVHENDYANGFRIFSGPPWHPGYTPTRNAIATIHWKTLQRIGHDQSLANARLIAASPELLDAAKLVISFQKAIWAQEMKAMAGESRSPRFAEWLTPSFKKLHDAIAKAEG